MRTCALLAILQGVVGTRCEPGLRVCIDKSAVVAHDQCNVPSYADTWIRARFAKEKHLLSLAGTGQTDIPKGICPCPSGYAQSQNAQDIPDMSG